MTYGYLHVRPRYAFRVIAIWSDNAINATRDVILRIMNKLVNSKMWTAQSRELQKFKSEIAGPRTKKKATCALKN